jgi:Raf kinase inhibitor-like YbhB/YbcL family protein
MKIARVITVLAVMLCLAAVVLAQAPRGGGGATPTPQAGAAPAAGANRGPAAPPMALTTTGWQDGAIIPNKYTQAVQMTVSPALTWTNAPTGTQSFVLHFHDPDVALNGTTNDQVHWLVWNIPATTTSFAEGMPAGAILPDGSRQISASGQVYRGPGAPAAGPYHHYTFEIYALDIKLDTVEPGANEQETRTKVMAAMQGHVRGKAVMFGLFRRPGA